VSNKLSHPNVVPFLGVYSAPGHPFALVYEMMENMDLGQYLAQHPNVSRLKLVSIYFTIPAAMPWLNPFSTAVRNLTWIEIRTQPRRHAWEHQVGMSSHFVQYRSMFTLF
jgi:serine/threonine protein kinase